MGETGEGIRPTKSPEIKPNVGVVELLRGAEKKASTRRFKDRIKPLSEAKGADSIKGASGMAVDQVSELLHGQGVVDEMVKLGVRVDLGNFSVSARSEDDEEKISFWKSINKFKRPPLVITVRVGPEEFEQRGVGISALYRRELGKMLDRPESRKDVWAAVEGLGNLTPRDIARGFRKSIEAGQSAVIKAQKQNVKEELKALRRGV